MSQNSQIGRIGEEKAANFLMKAGYRIRETNYRRPYGEIDIIGEKDGIVHFFEVKTSKYYPDSSFTPEIRVNARKIRKLKRICETYLRETHVSQDKPWQIDVISVILNEDNSVRSVNHIENAVFDERY